MEPKDIEEVIGSKKVLLAKDQPQYGNLPALLHPDGVYESAWRPTPDEVAAMMDGAGIRLLVWTFGLSHPPVRLEVEGISYES